MHRTPVLTTIILCCILVAVHLRYDTLMPSSWQQHGGNRLTTAIATPAASNRTHNNPVLTVLRQAAAGGGDSSSSSSLSLDTALKHGSHDPSCCRIGSMRGVLATATAFGEVAAAAQVAQDPDSMSSMQEARELFLDFRLQLAKPWAAAFQQVVRANTQAANNVTGCRCRSVELVQAVRPLATHSSSSSSSKQGTALLLVLDSWASLDRQLATYSANLLMLWFYARMHGYGLHIYVHGSPLPPWMPVFFIKPPGILHAMQELAYEHVVYVDFDVLTSPHTAPPLSLFYAEYPGASLLLQGEYNFCAGVNLWRNTPDAHAILQAWWEMGACGCCPTAQHDQSALKHIVLAYIANLTGDATVYPTSAQRRFKLPASLPPPPSHKQPPTAWEQFARQSSEPPPTPPSKWLQLRPLLQEKRSAIGLVGLDVHYPRQPGLASPKVALANCLGMWWGCISPETPSLLYHTGGSRMRKMEPEWMAQRITNMLLDWLTLHQHEHEYGRQQQQQLQQQLEAIV